jgi:predicted GIY-YIG superfamily endonuclease
MKYLESYTYQLFIETKYKKRVIVKKEQNGVACNFRTPITDTNRPKIYVLKSGSDILYVGYTNQSVSSRLSAGMRASGKNGYHGYKWRDYDKVDLLIFVFEKFADNKKVKEKQKLFIEGVEAEIVFKIRTETGKWPLSQNEIHFNNKKAEQVRAVTDTLYAEL